MTVQVPATSAGVGRAIEAVEAFFDGLALDRTVTWRLQVALDEALVNSVTHGYAGREGVIDLAVSVDGSSIEMVIEDDAPEFDVLSVSAPDVSASLEARQPGGLGIALVKSLVDSVSYARQHGRNRLTFRHRVRA
jgi:anti-sigma regulatory factor (Ser/Thr protein kinase)